jgi:hypothetical protein
MDWNILGAIGDFVGGVLVVVSVLYLAVQLRQANRHAQASAYVGFIDAWNSLLNDLVSDEGVQEAIRAGFADFNGLPKNHQAVFHMRIGAIVNHWLVADELCEKGLLPRELYEECTNFVISLLSTKGGLQYWERDAGLTPKGQELLDLIKSGGGANVPIDKLLPWWSSE